ncbi:AMP-binding protein [Methylothermus subterraneus]
MAEAPPKPEPPAATELLALIRSVADELKLPPQRLRALCLDTSFDRELGLDSLSRMELFARIEKHFGVRLPERLLAEAETPRDLLRAILACASGKARAQVKELVVPFAEAAAQPAPETAQTLIEVLAWHVKQHPDRTHILLLQDDLPAEPISYGELAAQAKRFARGLQDLGVEPGDTVALMLPTGKEYFFAFFGLLLAGAIPVPIYPPARLSQLEDHLLRHSKILNNCQAKLLVTVPEAKPVARLLKAQVPSLTQVITPEKLTRASGDPDPIPRSSQDIALLQYTSGSTGMPKGVILTHFNLLSNIRAMGKAVQADSRDVFVSWLPLYHDMGLIGAWLGSLYYGARLAVMSPLAFLAQPLRWLLAIQRHRATLTAAPNFAYELCLKRLAEEELKGLDLSSLRAMFNGAEPVSPATLERFAARFAPYGLKPEALMPVYGLAENSVGLTFPPLGRPPRVDRIDREVFCRTGKAIPAHALTCALRFVSCGRPLPGHEVRIVDEQGRELPERVEGRLEFRGPSSTQGYYRNPQATAALFDGDWLISGDRAYLADGEVYLTGREKDIVIHAGRNLYPQEIEEAVGRIAGIRAGCVAAFGSPDPQTGTERLIVVAETRETDPKAREKLIQAIQQQVFSLTGSAPDEVRLAPPGTVLKTSSGKIRRSACKEFYERGLLGRPLPLWRQALHLLAAAVRPQLRRRLRQIQALSFAAWAWSMAGAIGALGWLGVLVLPTLERRWRFASWAARFLARVTGISLRAEGLDHLPAAERPCIYVSNHASYLDGAAVLALIPRRFGFVAKREFTSQFIAGTFLKRIGCEFVERSSEHSVQDAKRLMQAAKRGRSLWFFPEGTFTRRPGLLPFRLGAFMTAAEAGLPVVPVTIRGTRQILRADSWFPRPGAISLIVSPPIFPQAVARELENPSSFQIAVRLRELARQAILSRLGEPDLAEEPSPLLRT